MTIPRILLKISYLKFLVYKYFLVLKIYNLCENCEGSLVIFYKCIVEGSRVFHQHIDNHFSQIVHILDMMLQV